jgi:hypothetical protein
MSHASRLLQKVKACGSNNASQSMAFDEYLRDNPEWAFSANVEFAQVFSLNTNTASKSNYVDELAKNCGAANVRALLLFLNSVDNVSTQSCMCDQIFPYIDKSEDTQPVINLLKESNSATASSASDTWEKVGGAEIKSDASVQICLGGFDIVSNKLAKVHAALRKVGKCDQGFEWKKGSFDDLCDKCSSKTGEGFNCAGGSHYVCMKCVKAQMGDGGGPGAGGLDNDEEEAVMVPRDACLAALNECNEKTAGANGDMNKMIDIQVPVMQKHGIRNPESLEKSCEKYASEGDKEIAQAYEKFINSSIQMMMGGGQGGNPMAAMMAGGGPFGGAPEGSGGANPMAAMMAGGGPFGGAPGGPGGANPVAAMMAGGGPFGGAPGGPGGANPMAGMFGGGPSGPGGANPMAAMMGGMMGGGGQGGNPMAAMMGGMMNQLGAMNMNMGNDGFGDDDDFDKDDFDDGF